MPAAATGDYSALRSIAYGASPIAEDVLRRAQRALAVTSIAGLASNVHLLQALALRPEMQSQQVHTRWLEEVLPELLDAAKTIADSACQTGV